MDSIIDEYRHYVGITLKTDYLDKKTIKNRNNAVRKMYEIVRNANAQGMQAIVELASLLDEKDCGKWLSHQLVEIVELPSDINKKCFSIIENLSKKNDIDAYGEKIWLDKWKSKKIIASKEAQP